MSESSPEPLRQIAAPGAPDRVEETESQLEVRRRTAYTDARLFALRVGMYIFTALAIGGGVTILWLLSAFLASNLSPWGWLTSDQEKALWHLALEAKEVGLGIALAFSGTLGFRRFRSALQREPNERQDSRAAATWARRLTRFL